MLYGLRDISEGQGKQVYLICLRNSLGTYTLTEIGKEAVIYFFESKETALRVKDELTTFSKDEYLIHIKTMDISDIPYFYQSCFGNVPEHLQPIVKVLIVKDDDYFVIPINIKLIPLDD